MCVTFVIGYVIPMKLVERFTRIQQIGRATSKETSTNEVEAASAFNKEQMDQFLKLLTEIPLLIHVVIIEPYLVY